MGVHTFLDAGLWRGEQRAEMTSCFSEEMNVSEEWLIHPRL